MTTVTDSLAQGWWMFWATLWALVLGFGLSGAVQAFVSRGEMERALGDHRPRTVARAGLLGAISSSCSYAASALAKSLFGRGADFTSAMAFMVASTNLVVELGLVLWRLIGWQFAVAELVGGTIMIALLAVVLPRAVPAETARAARERLTAGSGAGADCSDPSHRQEPPDGLAARPWRERVRSRRGWAEAAGYTVGDLAMVRKELVAGFLVAGFAAVAVPNWFWRSLFITGHGVWSSLENVVVGPFLAIISFVCSVGNVPLAAALWTGGISFGGVVAFVFADLITLPLLLIYRRYYGGALTLRLLAVFWAVMSSAGLATEYLFRAAGLTAVHHPAAIAVDHFGVNATTLLNLLALAAFAVLYRLHRTRSRHLDDDGDRYARDVVCGMQVERASAPASTTHGGRRYWFCSDRCGERFAAAPRRYAGSGSAPPPGPLTNAGTGESGPGRHATDPVCGMTVDAGSPAAEAEHAGQRYAFCGPGCRNRFLADPSRYREAHSGRG